MQIRTQLPAKQKGFSILSGFILTIILLGSLAFFLAGQGVNTLFGATYTNTSKVSTLLASAGYLNAGFDSVTLGGTAPAGVTFDTATTTGIFNPSTGGSSPQPLDPSLFQLRGGGGTTLSNLDGYWIYRSSDVKMNGVGTGTADYTLMVSGLKSAICQQINTQLHGPSATIPVLTLADAALLGATPGSYPTAPVTVNSLAVDLSVAGGFTSGFAASAGWVSGCYQTATATNYVYIHTVLAQ